MRRVPRLTRYTFSAPYHAEQAAHRDVSCAELGQAALSCAEPWELCRTMSSCASPSPARAPSLALTGLFHSEVRALAAVTSFFCFASEHRRACNVGRRLAPICQARRRRCCFRSKKSKGGCVLSGIHASEAPEYLSEDGSSDTRVPTRVLPNQSGQISYPDAPQQYVYPVCTRMYSTHPLQTFSCTTRFLFLLFLCCFITVGRVGCSIYY